MNAARTCNSIPVYIFSGFMDSGKTTLIKRLISHQKKNNKKVLYLSFEQGDVEMEDEFQKAWKVDTLEIPVEAIEQDEWASDKIEYCLYEKKPDEIWIEWNGMKPIVALFNILKKLDIDIHVEKHVFVADGDNIQLYLNQTKGILMDQLSNSDVAVLRNIGEKNSFKDMRRYFRDLNPGVGVVSNKHISNIEEQVFGRHSSQERRLALVLLTCIVLGLYGRSVIEIRGNSMGMFTGVCIGILLQAIPFLMIGVLLSSAIQVFVPENFFQKHFPRNRALGMVFALLGGFCLPVCDCASVPVFKGLVKKKVPVATAVTFMMASPVINPVVILSTWYAFGGSISMVLCRVGLGMICAVIIGLCFCNMDEAILINGKLGPQNYCNCGYCSLQDQSSSSFGAKLWTYFNHASAEFISVGKYLVIGAIVSSLIQTWGKNISQSNSPGSMLVSIAIMMGMAFMLSLCSSSDAVVARTFSASFPMSSIMAFLVFGPMLDVKNLIMLTGNFTKKFTARLCLITIIVCGGIIYLVFRLGLGEAL